jgi:hypothetical protein
LPEVDACEHAFLVSAKQPTFLAVVIFGAVFFWTVQTRLKVLAGAKLWSFQDMYWYPCYLQTHASSHVPASSRFSVNRPGLSIAPTNVNKKHPPNSKHIDRNQRST